MISQLLQLIEVTWGFIREGATAGTFAFIATWLFIAAGIPLIWVLTTRAIDLAFSLFQVFLGDDDVCLVGWPSKKEWLQLVVTSVLAATVLTCLAYILSV